MDDSWKDTATAFDTWGELKTIRELEAIGWVFDWDGSELQEIMKSITYDPEMLKNWVKDKDGH